MCCLFCIAMCANGSPYIFRVEEYLFESGLTYTILQVRSFVLHSPLILTLLQSPTSSRLT